MNSPHTFLPSVNPNSFRLLRSPGFVTKTAGVMAQIEAVNMASRRLPPTKRRMSRDILLPDISNLPQDPVRAGKVARRPQELNNPAKPTSAPEKQKQVTFATGEEVRHGRFASTGGNPTRLPRLKGNKPKPKSTPYATGQEPMDVDNPAMAIRAMLTRVPNNVTNIDDHFDPLFAPEYARESQLVLPCDYLAKNPEVTPQMRAILMDWLIQVQTHEQMEDETLQLAVKIIDQYLARAEVPLPKLQLVGITGILIGAKFIERFPPVSGTLCALTAGTYMAEEVLAMEKDILRELKFDVSLPVPQFFLDRYIRVHAHDPRVEQLALYLIDLSLPSVLFVPVAPSVLAASALYVARKVYQTDEQDTWTLALAFYTKYTDQDLIPSVRLLAKMLLRAAASKYQGARQKHSDTGACGGVSMDPFLNNHPGLLELSSDDTKTMSVPVVS
ncbi:hypothetical protein BaRGS_00017240 [Batillaria attramentaria]|uniref:Cyclin N-terminal domain-containing protein n=1 Tax=Batillaria attramentaria TaxID=370345 RepID=A0ABD0KX37_9CAEN